MPMPQTRPFAPLSSYGFGGLATSEKSCERGINPASVRLHTTVTFILNPLSLLSLFMNRGDKRNPKNWTKEESDRVVAVFQWLLDQDRKQNPHLYTKKANLQEWLIKTSKELK